MKALRRNLDLQAYWMDRASEKISELVRMTSAPAVSPLPLVLPAAAPREESSKSRSRHGVRSSILTAAVGGVALQPTPSPQNPPRKAVGGRSKAGARGAGKQAGPGSRQGGTKSSFWLPC